MKHIFIRVILAYLLVMIIDVIIYKLLSDHIPTTNTLLMCYSIMILDEIKERK